MGNEASSDQGDWDNHFAPATPSTNTDYRHARSAWAHSILMRPFTPAEHNPAANQHQAPSEAPSHRKPTEHRAPPVDPRLITVVGVCSAGKSTLARTLREKGYRARTVAQEHSYIPQLWQHSRPDVLIYLDASLPTIRRRRNARWHQPMLDEEHRRLAHARQHAHLYIHTDGLTPHDVAARTVTFLNNSKARDAE